MDAPDLLSLEGFKRARSLNETDDDLILRYIHSASDLVRQMTKRAFVPYFATKVYDGRGKHLQYNRTAFDLDEDLLVLVEVTDGGEAVDLNDILYESPNIPPYWRLHLTTGSWGQVSDRQSITLTGWWGYHESYDTAFVDVTTILSDIDDSDTTIAVDLLGDVETLAYYRIDEEIIQVTHINDIDGVALIRRATRGTTAASHLSGAMLERFVPEADIVQATERLVSFFYDRRDTVGDTFVVAGGSLLIQGRLPGDLETILKSRQRIPFAAM